MSYCEYLLEKYCGVNEVSKEFVARANAKASYLYSDELPQNRSYMRAAFDAQGNSGNKTYAKPGDHEHIRNKQYFQSLMQRKRDAKSDPDLKDKHDARVKDYDNKENTDYKNYQRAQANVNGNKDAIRAHDTENRPLVDAKPYLDYQQKLRPGEHIERMPPNQRQRKLLPINGEPRGGWQST